MSVDPEDSMIKAISPQMPRGRGEISIVLIQVVEAQRQSKRGIASFRGPGTYSALLTSRPALVVSPLTWPISVAGTRNTRCA